MSLDAKKLMTRRRVVVGFSDNGVGVKVYMHGWRHGFFLYFHDIQSKGGIGCKFPLMFFEYNSWRAKEMKLNYAYYYFG